METEASKMIKQPSYRFAGYTEPWEEKKLGEVAEVNPKSVVPDEFKYVDLGAVVGTEMVSYRNETISTSPSRAQRLAIKGDIFYQTVRPYQKNNYLFEKDDNDYVFSTGYAQLRPSGDGCFLLSYLQTNKFVNVVLDNCTGTSYPAINSKDLSDIFISLPSLSEQTAIGSLFQDIDQLISLQQRKLEVLKEQKKTYLKLLFPAKGQTKPALRFAGFEDKWKEVKLGEVFEFSKGKGLQVDSFYEGEDNLAIAYGHLYTLYNEVITKVQRSSDNECSMYSNGNELLFPASSTVPFGTAKVVALLESGVKLGGDIIVASSDEKKVNNIFMSYNINSMKEKMYPITVGTTITHMYAKDLKELRYFLPSLPEQEAIGSFFQDLDKAIAKQEEKVNQLKESKQTLLRKMFI